MVKKGDILDNFKRVLKSLQKINSNCQNPIVLASEFDEQFENLEDLEKLFKDFSKVLDGFKSLDVNRLEEVDKYFAEVHRILTTFEWHVSEVSDVNTKIFKEYSNRISK